MKQLYFQVKGDKIEYGLVNKKDSRKVDILGYLEGKIEKETINKIYKEVDEKVWITNS